MSDSSIGSRILQSVLPQVVKENIDVAVFLLLLSYVLFLVNWLVTTDWIEKASATPFLRLVDQTPFFC